LQSKKTLTKLNDSKIDSICCAICRTKATAKISVARLKLAIFWIKHQDCTMHEISVIGKPLVKVNLNTILTLKTQKHLEDEWRSGNKEPEYSPVALDLALATKAYDKTRTILTRVQAVTGVLLAYVIWHVLKPLPEDEDPPFGETDWVYTSIDQELIPQAPIQHEDADTSNNEINLEADGPFDLSFLTDSKKVWAILHALFSASVVWQHVKKYSTT
jgi:hypothetical protein